MHERRIYSWAYAFEKLLDVKKSASTSTTVYDNHMRAVEPISQFLPTILGDIDNEFGAEDIEVSMLYVLCIFQLAVSRASISLSLNNVMTLLTLSVSTYDKLVSDGSLGVTFWSPTLNCTTEDMINKEFHFLTDLRHDLRVDDSHICKMRNDLMRFTENDLLCDEHMPPKKYLKLHGCERICM
jgi:hypothetical protein